MPMPKMLSMMQVTTLQTPPKMPLSHEPRLHLMKPMPVTMQLKDLPLPLLTTTLPLARLLLMQRQPKTMPLNIKMMLML